jgi:WD40 repeat protein
MTAEGGPVSKESLGLPPVLAAPPRRSRRHRVIVAVAAHLAVILGTAGVIALIQWSDGSAGPAATLTSPGDGQGTTAAFSPDGKTLAISEGRVTLWDVATRHRIATVTEPGAAIGSIAFNPDGSMLAGTDDALGRTYLWNVATGHLTATLTDPAGTQGVGSVAFSPDGRTLAAGDIKGSTYLWNVATGHLAATLTDPSTQGVGSAAFSPNGRTLATSDGNGNTYLWNVATRHPAATLTTPGSLGVPSVAFSPDGRMLATGDVPGDDVQLWDVGGGR